VKGFLVLLAAVFLAIGIGVGAIDATTTASVSSVPRPTVLSLPTNFYAQALAAGPTEISITGSVRAPESCASISLNLMTKRFGTSSPDLSSVFPTGVAICGTELTTDDWVVQTAEHGETEVHLAVRNSPTSTFTIGPTLMTTDNWSLAHDGTPVASDGSVWIYDDISKPTSVERVSMATGRIENRIPLPHIGLNPVMAADEDGLWIAPSQGWSQWDEGPSPIFRIAPGSDVATIVHRGGSAVQWIVASGRVVWADVVGPLPSLTETVWRFDGADATPAFSTPGPTLPGPEGQGTGYVVVGNASEGLFTLKGTLHAPAFSELCRGRVQVVEIDPDTGRQTVIDTIEVESDTPWVACSNDDLFSPGQVTLIGNSLYVLWDQTPTSEGGYTKLYDIVVG
jgi:hypothetical protein